MKTGNSLVKRVTITPELEGSMETIAYLSSQGLLVSLGHSEADYATSFRAFLQGAKLVTHVFNDMGIPCIIEYRIFFPLPWVLRGFLLSLLLMGYMLRLKL